ncbi:quaternary ammonium compound-resistance protein SugE [Actinoalloteichus hoggarensis]|uniref:Quaternary ammonium compound-resistance protein SugE n=1 Tax=Actinoalloteichus hoggarensis TaxID=1470176 RepID=A0A221WBK0_9PSEU|nr:multidrug efflux SMR transporter [Actinoalloteichus hoggarensis]ASO22657.1 Quaternary ammonium compound-resistance protein SugE [Actinoalloteichus hoggarensis]MBB5924201.1 quaternary ammonium compound-resistance protein SugE [Actinoalloteichus hoggarensis]
MNSGWIAVIAAGVLEIAWAHSIRLTDGFTRLLPTLVCGVLTVAVLLVLNFAMLTLPVGTAYAVFVGIGATGTALAGMLWLREPVDLVRIAALALIVGGVVLLHVADRAPAAAAG